MRSRQEGLTRWLWMVAVLALAACASSQGGGGTRAKVPITEVKSVVGRWDGLISGLSSMPSVDQDLLDIVIKADATYEAKAFRTVGAFRERGTIELKDGNLVFRAPGGETATGQLFAVNGRRVLDIDTTASDGRRVTARLSPRP